MTMRRKGFTTLELLIVIGIIVILAGLVIWGLSAAGNNSAINSTRVTLQNLTNMLEELNRKNKLAGFEVIYPPPPLPAPQDSFEDAPGFVTDASTNLDRKGPQVQRTAEVIRRLMALPDNKKAIEKFPSDQLMQVLITNSSSSTATPGTVILDGWRNPIIFVPSGGLKGVGTKPLIRSPDGRPFWASAGPDGAFGLLPNGKNGGNDNIYSFEQ